MGDLNVFMLIALEAQRLFRQHKHGMDVVALELIKQLQQLDKKNEYLILAAKGPDSNCISDADNFSKQIIGGLTYADWEQISLPRFLKKIKPDLIHCTANTAPLFCPAPLILTLHDIIFLEETNFKGSAYQNFGNVYRRYVGPRVIRNARKIITVSEYEKQVIIEKCKDARGKVEVIYNAVNKRFNTAYTAEQIDNFRVKYKLPSSFILLLGNTAPKKNTVCAIKAYEHYCKISSDPLPLVLVDYKQQALNKNIIYPGYVPAAEMPLLYNAASVFLYPSLRESFGMPILEAMACGIPVITSNTSAIPEVAGDAAIFIDPSNYVEIAEKLQQLILSAELINSLQQKGLTRASHFNWESSAKQLLAIYNN
jgi:glycosyltransferase involved in cell wall biosynthesis